MKRPSLRVRVLGCPPVSFGLLALYAYIIWQWYGDQMPFIMMLAAVFAAFKTAKAYDQKREFRTRGDAAGDTHSPRLFSLSALLRILLALWVGGSAAVYQRQVPEGSTPALAWQGVMWLAMLYLSVVLVRLVTAWRRRKKTPAAVAPPPPPVCWQGFVSWMIPVPAYSATRADAERELPEYCARLLQRREPAAQHAVLMYNAPMDGRSAREL